MLQCPDSLTVKTLKACYFPRQNVLNSQVGFVPSYMWRNIHESLWVLHGGGFWKINLALDVYIWRDNWILSQGGHRLWTYGIFRRKM